MMRTAKLCEHRMFASSSSEVMLPPHLAAAKEAIVNGEALLVDVREQNEWDQAHFKSAIHVPLSGLQLRGVCPQEVLESPHRLYLHCAAGVRVHPAAAALSRLGCPDVVPLSEGLAELYHLQFDDIAE